MFALSILSSLLLMFVASALYLCDIYLPRLDLARLINRVDSRLQNSLLVKDKLEHTRKTLSAHFDRVGYFFSVV